MAKKKRKSDEPDFEQSLAELERIVQQLEGGNSGLSESLAAYQVGMKHLKSCYAHLEKAERRIELLSGVDADGNPITRPFDEDDDDDAPQKPTRGKKRSARPSKKNGSDGSEDDIVDDGNLLF